MHNKKLKKQGILFHQFHSYKSFYKSPGSLNKDIFYKFIKNNIKRLRNPEEFLNSKNSDKIMTLTFDDGLKSQYEIALDIMDNFKIKGFFFIFTEFLKNEHLTIENIRYFKYKFFKNANSFYKSFFKTYEELFSKNLTFNYKKEKEIFKIYAKESRYYNYNDIAYKVVRDNKLNMEEYKKIILEMLKRKKVDLKSLTKKLYMSKNDIINLSNLNHVIGLHSHSHTHKNYLYSYKEELSDYIINKNILEKIIKKKIYCLSYPFGNYTDNSEEVLSTLGIKYAFCKNSLKINKFKNQNFCLPRENISNLLKLS